MRIVYAPLLLAITAAALASGGFGGAAKTKKKKASAPLAEESAAYAALRTWAVAGGANLDGVRESDGGLVATKDIKKNAVLATLPSDLALSLCDPDEDEADHAACAKNYFEFKYNEQFGEYAATLPAAPPTPTAWSSDEIASLQWPPLQEEIAARQKRIGEVASSAGLEADAVERLAAIAAARAYEIHLDQSSDLSDEEKKEVEGATQMSSKVIRLLLPFLDSAKRASAPSAKVDVKDPQRDASTFVLKAQRALVEGDAVTVGYNVGVATTADVLLNHGSVPGERLDGSSYADARLLAREGGVVPGDAPPSDDRAIVEDAAASTAAREAARMRLALKSAKTNKKHTGFFKAIQAGGRIGPGN